MEEKQPVLPIEKLRLDKETLSELAGANLNWVKFLVISQTIVAVLNSALLLTGTLKYGKETVKILKQRMENQR